MFEKLIIRLILITFFFVSIGPLPDVSAQTLIDLPAPGVMVNRSESYQPLALKGILVNVKNPLRFDFLIDKGESSLYGQSLKDEIIRSTKYFLTSLAVPEEDLWVNLSPYEKDRIVPGNFGITLMGKDLLEQDYLLKQIMASLSYPENELGKKFWQKVYHKAYELYGTTNIPINTFNKVWILPKSADVYVQGNAAFVVHSQLDVMLEADYKAMARHQATSQSAGAYSQVFRDVILPELRQEINEGKNFAVVRQVYNAMILATWYKKHLKDSLLGKLYVGKNQVKGVDITDVNAKEEIYHQYLRAYKKCVYNYVKEDYDPIVQQTVPHKYASGGMNFSDAALLAVYKELPNAYDMIVGSDLAMATVDVAARTEIGFLDSREITNTHPFHFEDRAMFSSVQIRELTRKVILPLAVMTAMSVSSPVLASQITPNHGGKTLHVRVQSNDTFGKILLQAGYTKMPLWGSHGAVHQLSKAIPGINVERLHEGQQFNIPTKEEFYKQKTKKMPIVGMKSSFKKSSKKSSPVLSTMAPVMHDLTVSSTMQSLKDIPLPAAQIESPDSTLMAVEPQLPSVEKNTSSPPPPSKVNPWTYNLNTSIQTAGGADGQKYFDLQLTPSASYALNSSTNLTLGAMLENRYGDWFNGGASSLRFTKEALTGGLTYNFGSGGSLSTGFGSDSLFFTVTPSGSSLSLWNGKFTLGAPQATIFTVPDGHHWSTLEEVSSSTSYQLDKKWKLSATGGMYYVPSNEGNPTQFIPWWSYGLTYGNYNLTYLHLPGINGFEDKISNFSAYDAPTPWTESFTLSKGNYNIFAAWNQGFQGKPYFGIGYTNSFSSASNTSAAAGAPPPPDDKDKTPWTADFNLSETAALQGKTNYSDSQGSAFLTVPLSAQTKLKMGALFEYSVGDWVNGGQVSSRLTNEGITGGIDHNSGSWEFTSGLGTGSLFFGVKPNAWNLSLGKGKFTLGPPQFNFYAVPQGNNFSTIEQVSLPGSLQINKDLTLSGTLGAYNVPFNEGAPGQRIPWWSYGLTYKNLTLTALHLPGINDYERRISNVFTTNSPTPWTESLTFSIASSPNISWGPFIGWNQGFHGKPYLGIGFNQSFSTSSHKTTPTPAAPSVPTSLKVTPGNNQVALTWATSPGASSYTVTRSINKDGTYIPLTAGTGIKATSFIDTTAVNGTTYYYEVQSINADLKSSFSEYATATPAVPVNVPQGDIFPLEDEMASNIDAAVAGVSNQALDSTDLSVQSSIVSEGSVKSDDKAMTRNGGIDMNSRWMQLNISGKAQPMIGVDGNVMPGVIIKGVVPRVSGIVVVTPGMLSAILGRGYLNLS